MLKYVSLLAACSIAYSASLNALIVLDDVMSQEDQKKTGVSSLTYQQKVALEDWLNQYCVMKKVKRQQKQKQLFLSINIDGGQKIQLSDNSMWQISPDDLPTAATWITPIPIQIVPSNYPDYPWLLVDTQTGVSIKAKKISPTTSTPSGPS